MKGLSKLRIISVSDLPKFKEPFANELILLWKERGLRGVTLLLEQHYEKSIEPVGFMLVEMKKNENINRGLFIREHFRGQGGAHTILGFLHNHFSNKFIWTNITEGIEELYDVYEYKTVGYRKEFKQTVAYYSKSNYTEEQVEQLKQKVDE